MTETEDYDKRCEPTPHAADHEPGGPDALTGYALALGDDENYVSDLGLANLGTLTDNSIADALHRHSELVASDGAPDPALSVDAWGRVGIGTTEPREELEVVGDIKLSGNLKDETFGASRIEMGGSVGISANNDVTLAPEGIVLVMMRSTTRRVGINTQAPRTTLQVVGDVKFGDLNTNYTTHAADGELFLVGTARVKRHIRVAAPSWKGGVTAPSPGFVGILPTLDFDWTSDDSVHYSLICPYRLAAGTTMDVDVDWCHAGDEDDGTVKWALEYINLKSGEVVAGVTATTSKTTAGSHTAGQMVRTRLTTPMSGMVAHDVIGLRLYRDTAGDTLGVDAKMIQVHFEFTMNKLGQPT